MESGRQSLTYLDTHTALWLSSGEVPLSGEALREIEYSELRLSPVVFLEMQLLQEIGRINVPPSEWLAILRRDFDVTVCTLPFQAVVEASCGETWTRDPFDRLIVAQARAGAGKLITKDLKIREHFAQAVW